MSNEQPKDYPENWVEDRHRAMDTWLRVLAWIILLGGVFLAVMVIGLVWWLL